nr:LCP family protein [Clostridia bacterium]
GDDLRILEISRDTMTEVDTYSPNGDYLSTGVMQINMQYSFGDSPRRSAYLTKKTVSRLLRGIDISGAVSLDMSGITPVVNALGGIDVRMEEDCSYIDPEYTEGAEVHLDGADAEYFIRWRDKASVGSNDTRMGRHAWFIRQMLTQSDEADFNRLLNAADPYVNTDMTAEEMKALYECEFAETIRLPGESTRGPIHDEFYVDEDALEEVLIRLFYRPAS